MELNGKVKRYGELRRDLSDITPKMLTQALRELEQDALLTGTVYLEIPPRVEYQQTETGKELIPFIQLLSRWAKQQMNKNNIPILKEETS